jgi:hypothetical protein
MVKDIHVGTIVTAIFMAVFWFFGCSGGMLLAANLTEKIENKKYHPKMESVLGVLLEKFSKSRATSQVFAHEVHIPLQDDQVTVILVPSPGKGSSTIDQTQLTSYGTRIEARSRHLIRVRIPLSSLKKIADEVAGISYIRVPYTPYPPPTLITSQGVALIGAQLYHDLGYNGQNTKIALIDLGFRGLEDAQASGDIPSPVITKDFTGTGLTNGVHHGAEVAEIVHDVAPEAQLYLVKIGDEVDLENAKDYCINQGVDIINHSWGWFNTNFTDGAGLVCDITNDAWDHGILWVNAAGNLAHEHYQDFFRDTDNDSWHEFDTAPIDEINYIQYTGYGSIVVYLTWNCWPVTDQDYDLYLYDSNLHIVASSTTRQNGGQPPTEMIVYDPASPGTYYIAVKKHEATGDQELKIFSFYQDLQYQTPAHSIWAPADATGVVAVGAIDQADWYTGPQESYSSQGSTNDGRIKPDISGPDAVTTYTNPVVRGTSFASPHMAGAASLVLSRYSDCSVAQLQATLEAWAVDMGASGKDNIYGSGRLNLLLVSPFGMLDEVKVYPNPFKPNDGDFRTGGWNSGITFDGLTSDARIRIFSLTGELIREVDVTGQVTWTWDVENMNGKKVVRGVYIYLITNSAGEKKSGKIAVIK